MSTDKITTLSGGVVGIGILLFAFGVLEERQFTGIQNAAPLIAAAIAALVNGYFTNK
ncbi:hypothetical protein H6F43_03955 [Leptolyngbya sp. FACHB-36]|uniref:hypothetical protein n=1 Tax=Leptolyngbya sp. FACHB-36 TaxID=2692808 RepID=UPI0016806E28|nr:hypothetical protein [Leptolyngbya sp. FACHB-36]MBD2019337.1 hypothetical protein [Leptolyngbya sp. FACHB-36]